MWQILFLIEPTVYLDIIGQKDWKIDIFVEREVQVSEYIE